MKSADHIKKMTLRVEYDCHGRDAYLEVDLNKEIDVVSLRLRMEIDERIRLFRAQHAAQKIN